ncbi:MAG: histidine--tRNA ligase [Candidatus Ryanbacteria bacterium RIFCSPHIGHO2_01_FULL_48_27]|uniref:Histidine--tRNA ligase n=1 Tax=Candidatus Ryanbacteria bacterium RIFCSPHIGHO2_01_FULL_48_27 TaxID=1802115 RepID=A0A1G2G6M8_9BACT|nr:MAG: histidine--tRNA ligase [Candidatus Ryanbacteria bacterium RIFCSPHIGHO2_01_FULL_48_27]
MSKKQAREAIQTPKGTHDILPGDFPYWDKIVKIGESLAEFYGFQRIETPHFEKTDLFTRTLGDTSDVVEKQMYSFRTRGGDTLTLRPEGTAPVARAFIEHGMSQWPQPVKLFYHGSFFRHENPQRGRFREFGQFGFELIGDEDPVSDAFIIRIFYTMLEEVGFKNIAVHINTMGDDESRASFKKELTAFYRKKINSLCKDCKRRLKENPLRLLDCKEQSCVELKEHAPQILKYLSEASKKQFKVLLEYLDEGKIPYFLNPHLVRGFDYYTGAVFEIFINCEDGSVPETVEESTTQGKPVPIAMASGGRYDNLIYHLGGKRTSAVGGGFGIDRVVQEMKTQGVQPLTTPEPRLFLVQLGPAAKKKLYALLEGFRKAGIPVAESLTRDSIKTQLKIASKIGVDYALILGQREALEGTVIIREMTTGAQETVFMDKVIEEVKTRLKNKKR